MQIVRYTSEKKGEWDAFVEDSKNGSFLFFRDYMDYHSQRFADHSLLYYNDRGRLLAVMPANENDGILYSHQGLTYGGLVLGTAAHTTDVLDMFTATLSYLEERGFTEWIYKQMPVVYHRYPAQEDEYALWRMKAEQVACGMSTTIVEGMNASRNKHLRRNQLLRKGYTIEYDADLATFWPLLEDNLQRTHNLKPVHTLAEMQLLKERFPNNIVCCVARNANGEVESGGVMYLYGNVAHTQYLSSSPEGKKNNTMDILVMSLIEHYLHDYRYFDFGISTERDGEYLNEGLITQKESFGGRGVVYKIFRIRIG